MAKNWNLTDRNQYQEIAEEIKQSIEVGGMTAHNQIIYGKTKVAVHNDGTATVIIESNGKTFVFALKLYSNGYWDVLE